MTKTAEKPYPRKEVAASPFQDSEIGMINHFHW